MFTYPNADATKVNIISSRSITTKNGSPGGERNAAGAQSWYIRYEAIVARRETYHYNETRLQDVNRKF